MSDVMQSAQNYRERLKAELGRVENFLRFAEQLLKSCEAGNQSMPPAKTAGTPMPSVPMAERESSVGGAKVRALDNAPPVGMGAMPEPAESSPGKRGLKFRNAYAIAELDQKKIVA